jgi:hypothetical protein
MRSYWAIHRIALLFGSARLEFRAKDFAPRRSLTNNAARERSLTHHQAARQ